MYSVHNLKKSNILELLKVVNILYKCGKHMKKTDNLSHWNNSRMKICIITVLCAIKNSVYLVYENNIPVATFQTKKNEGAFFFQKLATLPDFSKKGVGTFCLNEIERLGRIEGCQEVICDVYDKSEYAKNFYMRRGYTVCGIEKTVKYHVLKLRKKL